MSGPWCLSGCICYTAPMYIAVAAPTNIWGLKHRERVPVLGVWRFLFSAGSRGRAPEAEIFLALRRSRGGHTCLLRRVYPSLNYNMIFCCFQAHFSVLNAWFTMLLLMRCILCCVLSTSAVKSQMVRNTKSYGKAVTCICPYRCWDGK